MAAPPVAPDAQLAAPADEAPPAGITEASALAVCEAFAEQLGGLGTTTVFTRRHYTGDGILVQLHAWCDGWLSPRTDTAARCHVRVFETPEVAQTWHDELKTKHQFVARLSDGTWSHHTAGRATVFWCAGGKVDTKIERAGRAFVDTQL